MKIQNIQVQFNNLVTRSLWKAAILLSVAAGLAPVVPGQSVTTLNLGTQSRNPDFSGLGFTRPISVGNTVPTTCLVGQLFFNSSASAGSNIYACTATNTWTAIGSQSLVLPLAVASGGTGTSTPGLIAGSNVTVTGTWPNQTVSATGGSGTGSGNATTIQGAPVSSNAPANNQTLIYNSTSSSYVPATVYTLQNGMGTTTSGSGALQVNVSMGIRAVTTTTDAVLPADCGGLVTYNSASAVTVAIPQPGLAGNFQSGCPVTVRNYGTGVVTITPSNSTIGGAATQTVAQGKGCQVVSDGANWQLGVCN